MAFSKEDLPHIKTLCDMGFLEQESSLQKHSKVHESIYNASVERVMLMQNLQTK